MEPPSFPASALHTVRAAPGSPASLLLPLPAGQPPFHFAWSRAGASLDERFTSTDDAGGVRLTVSAARTGDTDVYTLQASNAAGTDTARVRLEVSPDEAPTGEDPPTFLRRLQDLTVKVGTRTRFLVEIISSTECKVTWYRNERRLLEAERVALARDGNFWCADVTAVSVDDAGRWTCTAENAGGRASCSAHLNVLVPKAYKRPEFVEELRALLTEQGTVSLECKVVGVPTPVLRWFKDSREIKAGDVFALTANAEDPTSLGTYTCEAVNCMGRAYSSSKVHVVGRGSREGSSRPSSSLAPEPPPIFTKELEDQFVKITEPLTLGCHIVVPPWPRSVVWYNKEGKVEPGDRYHVLEDGAGGYLLEIPSAQWPDEGEWKCVACSAGGRVGISTCYVTMDVPKNYRKPRFMENLQAVLTEEGLVSFECKVVGFPTPVLSWFKDGQELKPGDVYQLTGTNSLGSYCCIARNCMGQASSSAELTVEDIQNQLNEEEKHQLFQAKNQAPKFIQGLKSVEAKIDEPFRFTVKVAIPPEPSVLWYRDDQPMDESTRCHHGKEDRGVSFLDIQNLEFLDQAEWKCVAMNDFGHSVTSCFLKLLIPRHYKKPRFLENLQAILSDEGAVNLECKVIGVPQPVLKWYKDGEELKPGDIHRIISGQDGTCCLGTYTCEAQNCMGIAASSASLLGFDDSMKAKKKKAEEQALQRNLSLSTIHEERTSQMYDTPVGDITLNDDKGEISFSFDGKEVSVSLYETPDLTEEEALQIVEMYADQLSENITEHNVVELPPLRFVKETSTSGNLLMEAVIIDVSPDYFQSPDEDLRTEADVEDISIADENVASLLSLEQDDIGAEDYLERTIAMLSDEKSDIPLKSSRKKTDSQRSADDFYSLSRDQSMSEEKKDDDTQPISESEMQSFASAHSSGKPKSKSSKPSGEDGIESSEPTKTILLKDEVNKQVEPSPSVKTKRVRRSSRGSRRSSSGSEKSVSKSREAAIRKIESIELEVPQKPSMSENDFKQKMSSVSTSLTKVINDVQIIERDIILKSELMSSAATASRSLEIISSLISPLSEIHSIADATKEAASESKEVSSTLFNSLPQPLKALQQSLTIIEKCIDMESDSRTLVKKTCVAFIETCGQEMQKMISEINDVTSKDYLTSEDKILTEIESLNKEMSTVIKFSSDTIKARNLISEANDIKVEEPSQDSKHLKDTQKAVFELKTPLNSLLCIAESAESGKMANCAIVNNSDVILNDMSGAIQDLQTALEQIETLSVKEATSPLHKYNTEIIETVMESVVKLRTSFEQLSTEARSEDEIVLKQAICSIKENLNKISFQIKTIETTIGAFDVLASENKLDALQKMAQILIALENNLPRLETIPEVKVHLTAFHKDLTKILENVIESNESKKYFTLMEICDGVNRINTSIKNLDADHVLHLASLNNTLRIIQEQFINNVFDSELNCSVLSNVSDILMSIQEAINVAEEITLHITSEHAQDITPKGYDNTKANVIIEHIEHTIASIENIRVVESTQEMKLNIGPILENICPLLEEIKRSVAAIKTSGDDEEHISDMSDAISFGNILATPLCELNQNVTVLNQQILENFESLKENNEIISAVAEPLQLLYTTLEILQQDVISQYGEDVVPYDVSVYVASAVQNLQSCIVMIQEQAGVEGADEMSTLEDISGIKTTADTIPSDRLVLPTAEETAIQQALLPFEQEQQASATALALHTLNDHINVLQTPEIMDALDTLSEVSDYSSLKYFAVGLGNLHNAIEEIFHPIVMEASNDLTNLVDPGKLTTVAEPMQELRQSLSVLDTSNIPIYENLLEMPTEKIHSVMQSVSEFKEHLDKCMLAVFPATQTTDNTIEIANKVGALREVCENLKVIIETTKNVEMVSMPEEIKALKITVNNLLDATDVSKGIKIEQVKAITEKLYENIITVQEEIIQFTPSDKLAHEAKLIQTFDEVQNNIAVLEQYDFIDLSNVSDITTCPSLKVAAELESSSLAQISDIVDSAVNIVQDSAKETLLADLMIVEDFFKTCKNEFTILRCLIPKASSHKKIIRLLQEFTSLQCTISDFKNKKLELNLSDDINSCLSTFLICADDCLESVQASLIKIVNSQAQLLISTPLVKFENASKLLKDKAKPKENIQINEIIKKFTEILDIANPTFKNLETDILNELRQLAPSTRPNDLLVKKLEEFESLVEQIKHESQENSIKNVLEKVSECIEKHHDYKDASGTGKSLILIKCLSDCADILQESLLEIKVTKPKVEGGALKLVLTEMLEPLQTLHTQLADVQEQVLRGVDDDSISINISTTESLVHTMTEKHQQIIENIEAHPDIAEDEMSLILEVNTEINSIKDSLKSTVCTALSAHLGQVVKEITQPVQEIEKSLHSILSLEKIGWDKLDTDVNSNIDSLENALDRFLNVGIDSIVESGIFREDINIVESIKIATELQKIFKLSLEDQFSPKIVDDKTQKITSIREILSKFDWQNIDLYDGKNQAETDNLKKIFLATYQLLAELDKVDNLEKIEVKEEKTQQIIQHIDQYIELIEIVEEISAIIRIEDVKETMEIAKELRDSLAASEAIGDQVESPESVKVNEKQVELAEILQTALSALQVQVLEAVQELAPEFSTEVLQRIAKVTAQLQADLIVVTGVHVALQPPTGIFAETTGIVPLIDQHIVTKSMPDLASVATGVETIVLEKESIIDHSVTTENLIPSTGAFEKITKVASEVVTSEDVQSILKETALKTTEELIETNAAEGLQIVTTEEVSAVLTEPAYKKDAINITEVAGVVSDENVQPISTTCELQIVSTITESGPKVTKDTLIQHIDVFLSEDISEVITEWSNVVNAKELKQSISIAKELRESIAASEVELRAETSDVLMNEYNIQQAQLAQQLYTALSSLENITLDNLQEISTLDKSTLQNVVAITQTLREDLVVRINPEIVAQTTDITLQHTAFDIAESKLQEGFAVATEVEGTTTTTTTTTQQDEMSVKPSTAEVKEISSEGITASVEEVIIPIAEDEGAILTPEKIQLSTEAETIAISETAKVESVIDLEDKALAQISAISEEPKYLEKDTVGDQPHKEPIAVGTIDSLIQHIDVFLSEDVSEVITEWSNVVNAEELKQSISIAKELRESIAASEVELRAETSDVLMNEYNIQQAQLAQQLYTALSSLENITLDNLQEISTLDKCTLQNVVAITQTLREDLVVRINPDIVAQTTDITLQQTAFDIAESKLQEEFAAATEVKGTTTTTTQQDEISVKPSTAEVKEISSEGITALVEELIIPIVEDEGAILTPEKIQLATETEKVAISETAKVESVIDLEDKDLAQISAISEEKKHLEKVTVGDQLHEEPVAVATIETLTQNINEFLSDNVLECVEQISASLKVDNLYQAVGAARDLLEYITINKLESNETGEQKNLSQNLQSNLHVAHALLANNSKELNEMVPPEALQQVTVTTASLLAELTSLILPQQEISEPTNDLSTEISEENITATEKPQIDEQNESICGFEEQSSNEVATIATELTSIFKQQHISEDNITTCSDEFDSVEAHNTEKSIKQEETNLSRNQTVIEDESFIKQIIQEKASENKVEAAIEDQATTESIHTSLRSDTLPEINLQDQEIKTLQLQITDENSNENKRCLKLEDLSSNLEKKEISDDINQNNILLTGSSTEENRKGKADTENIIKEDVIPSKKQAKTPTEAMVMILTTEIPSDTVASTDESTKQSNEAVNVDVVTSQQSTIEDELTNTVIENNTLISENTLTTEIEDITHIVEDASCSQILEAIKSVDIKLSQNNIDNIIQEPKTEDKIKLTENVIQCQVIPSQLKSEIVEIANEPLDIGSSIKTEIIELEKVGNIVSEENSKSEQVLICFENKKLLPSDVTEVASVPIEDDTGQRESNQTDKYVEITTTTTTTNDSNDKDLPTNIFRTDIVGTGISQADKTNENITDFENKEQTSNATELPIFYENTVQLENDVETVMDSAISEESTVDEKVKTTTTRTEIEEITEPEKEKKLTLNVDVSLKEKNAELVIKKASSIEHIETAVLGSDLPVIDFDQRVISTETEMKGVIEQSNSSNNHLKLVENKLVSAQIDQIIELEDGKVEKLTDDLSISLQAPDVSPTSSASQHMETSTLKVAKEHERLINHIQEFISEEVAENVQKILQSTHSNDLREAVELAKKLKSVMQVTGVEDIGTFEGAKVKQADLAHQLLDSLSVLHTRTLESAAEDEPVMESNKLEHISNIIMHLQEDLDTVIVSATPEVLKSSEIVELPEKEDNSMKHLESLLQEVTDKINVATERDADETESLKDALDEIQMVIIKLKQNYDAAANDALNETLEDLECSVRSVQLQINEDSPPELLKEACATLQLLVNNMSETQEVSVTELKTVEFNRETILKQCSTENEETMKLLDLASEIKTKDGNISGIITGLKVLKDTIKALKLSFSSNADVLIEDGVDIIQSLDFLEDKVFSLEKELSEASMNVDTRDSILTAIHSVYGCISNMRGTISSIQKRYMFDNYGKPSEILLRSIKNVAEISKTLCKEKENWKSFSKSLRKILNHFEDIKFYINLDKTARLPSDAAFTKIILEELKSNIGEVLVPQASMLGLDAAKKVTSLLECVSKNLSNIESNITLEVKKKIPIFKELSSQLFNVTEFIKIEINKLNMDGANEISKITNSQSVLIADQQEVNISQIIEGMPSSSNVSEQDVHIVKKTRKKVAIQEIDVEDEVRQIATDLISEITGEALVQTQTLMEMTGLEQQAIATDVSVITDSDQQVLDIAEESGIHEKDTQKVDQEKTTMLDELEIGDSTTTKTELITEKRTPKSQDQTELEELVTPSTSKIGETKLDDSVEKNITEGADESDDKKENKDAKFEKTTEVQDAKAKAHKQCVPSSVETVITEEKLKQVESDILVERALDGTFEKDQDITEVKAKQDQEKEGIEDTTEKAEKAIVEGQLDVQKVKTTETEVKDESDLKAMKTIGSEASSKTEKTKSEASKENEVADKKIKKREISKEAENDIEATETVEVEAKREGDETGLEARKGKEQTKDKEATKIESENEDVLSVEEMGDDKTKQNETKDQVVMEMIEKGEDIAAGKNENNDTMIKDLETKTMKEIETIVEKQEKITKVKIDKETEEVKTQTEEIKDDIKEEKLKQVESDILLARSLDGTFEKNQDITEVQAKLEQEEEGIEDITEKAEKAIVEGQLNIQKVKATETEVKDESDFKATKTIGLEASSKTEETKPEASKEKEVADKKIKKEEISKKTKTEIEGTETVAKQEIVEVEAKRQGDETGLKARTGKGQTEEKEATKIESENEDVLSVEQKGYDKTKQNETKDQVVMEMIEKEEDIAGGIKENKDTKTKYSETKAIKEIETIVEKKEKTTEVKNEEETEEVKTQTEEVKEDFKEEKLKQDDSDNLVKRSLDGTFEKDQDITEAKAQLEKRVGIEDITKKSEEAIVEGQQNEQEVKNKETEIKQEADLKPMKKKKSKASTQKEEIKSEASQEKEVPDKKTKKREISNAAKMEIEGTETVKRQEIIEVEAKREGDGTGFEARKGKEQTEEKETTKIESENEDVLSVEQKGDDKTKQNETKDQVVMEMIEKEEDIAGGIKENKDTKTKYSETKTIKEIETIVEKKEKTTEVKNEEETEEVKSQIEEVKEDFKEEKLKQDDSDNLVKRSLNVTFEKDQDITEAKAQLEKRVGIEDITKKSEETIVEGQQNEQEVKNKKTEIKQEADLKAMKTIGSAASSKTEETKSEASKENEVADKKIKKREISKEQNETKDQVVICGNKNENNDTMIKDLETKAMKEKLVEKQEKITKVKIDKDTEEVKTLTEQVKDDIKEEKLKQVESDILLARSLDGTFEKGQDITEVKAKLEKGEEGIEDISEKAEKAIVEGQLDIQKVKAKETEVKDEADLKAIKRKGSKASSKTKETTPASQEMEVADTKSKKRELSKEGKKEIKGNETVERQKIEGVEAKRVDQETGLEVRKGKEQTEEKETTKIESKKVDVLSVEERSDDKTKQNKAKDQVVMEIIEKEEDIAAGKNENNDTRTKDSETKAIKEIETIVEKQEKKTKVKNDKDTEEVKTQKGEIKDAFKEEKLKQVESDILLARSLDGTFEKDQDISEVKAKLEKGEEGIEDITEKAEKAIVEGQLNIQKIKSKETEIEEEAELKAIKRKGSKTRSKTEETKAEASLEKAAADKKTKKREISKEAKKEVEGTKTVERQEIGEVEAKRQGDETGLETRKGDISKEAKVKDDYKAESDEVKENCETKMNVEEKFEIYKKTEDIKTLETREKEGDVAVKEKEEGEAKDIKEKKKREITEKTAKEEAGTTSQKEIKEKDKVKKEKEDAEVKCREEMKRQEAKIKIKTATAASELENEEVKTKSIKKKEEVETQTKDKKLDIKAEEKRESAAKTKEREIKESPKVAAKIEKDNSEARSNQDRKQADAKVDKEKQEEKKEQEVREKKNKEEKVTVDKTETTRETDLDFKHKRGENGDIDRRTEKHQHYIKEYHYDPSKKTSEERPKFVDHNHKDYTTEFLRPSDYREKTFEPERYIERESTSLGKNATIYKAQSLIIESQLRSSMPPSSDRSESEKRIDRHRSKALSEVRSIISEKRSGLSRDLKRKPVFSTYLTDRTAVEGSRVKLTCSVLSSTDPKITWYKNGIHLDNKLKYRTKIIDGLITLEVLNAVPGDSAEYSCTVENENGSVNSSANLKVYPSFEASPIPPTFTRSIRDNYHLAENELVLECRIRGQPLPTITWLKDDRSVSTNERYQAYYLADGVCRLAISHPTPEDSGKYTCKAENSVWSDQITHIVNFTGRESRPNPNITTIERSRFNRQALESRRPHFTNVLSDYKVAKGGTIGLQVEIRGCPTRVEWLREGLSVTEVYRNAKTYVEHGLYTLALTDVTEKESGMYTCRAWSTHGNVDMNAAITVVPPNDMEGKPAIIAGRPDKDILISVGEDINISFRVQGEPKPKVVFMKGIRDITNDQRVCKMTSDDYVKFTLKRSGVSDAGTYCVLARNAYGCDRAFVTVVVRQRASSEHLISDWTYPVDDSALSIAERKYKSVPERIPGEPSVVDGGNNWLSLAWTKSDPGNSAPVLAYKVESWLLGKEGGARWTEQGITPLNSFDAFNLKQGEEYHFRVTPRNRYGWGESVQTSTPFGVGLAGDRPEFVDILPGQLKVLAGETANLSCSVKGKPLPEVLWMKNGHEIEEDSRVTSAFNGQSCCLTIKDINIEDEARYSCEATNTHGRASTYARLAVVTDRLVWEADAKLKRERSQDGIGEFPPQFTMRLRDRRVQATYPVRLTCQVVGSPPPSLTWFKDGEDVFFDSRRCKYQDEHFHTLEIAPTTLEDGGVYEAMARNSSGAVSCRCSLVVDKGIRAYVAPEFCCGLEPLYRLTEGEELRISAVVEAYPSVGVTWYRDGVRLRPSRRAIMTLDRDGQIELALASVTGRDAGVYTCTASNEVGRASTSGKVEIIEGEGSRVTKRTPPVVINAPDVPYSKEPMFTRKPRSSEAREGDTVIIQCEVIGDPKPEVYWLRDFLKPDYYRDATHFKRVGDGPEYRFEIPHAKLDYTGAYSVVARNVHGEAKAIISLQILVKDLASTDDVHNVKYGRVEVIPRFERELQDLLSYDGDLVEFECRVSGNPEPDIRWFHYNELIRDCPYYEASFDDGAARLKIRQVTAEDEGTYSCEASNSLGKATSSACLVVYPPGEPNTLSQRLRRPPALLSAASTPRSTPRSTPARSVSRTPGPDRRSSVDRRLCSPSRQIAPSFYTYPFNKVVEEGDQVTFQCAVKGQPTPWTTWDKDGIILTPSARVTMKEKDDLLRILEIEQVTIEDVGIYRITVENEYGRAEASARLEVITQKGKFYGGVRAYSASPRKSLSYRRYPSSSRQD